MQQVNVTELRNHLPQYLQQVKKGLELQITSHGRSIARLVPERSDVEEAKDRLLKLKGTMILGDITEPVETVEWSADADNL
ncbi:MAG: type II toxin-antitoxin system prevent-host-death family antitoxin [Deltaproteobacteria bacterium]|nr:type II toxin-antitoxin system prevent-host-death family antitoxin [Candidatus Tharpella aukensis]